MGLAGWLRRKDPGLRAVSRALRVTVVASLAFYLGRFVIDDAQLATYALFGVVALGALAQIPGGSRRRAATLLVALPAGALLVMTGTLLAAQTWAAVAGMALVGFAVSFAGVGGPVLVGTANGLQLLYILPCFPPYQPGELDSRLAGLCLGVGLLALAELTVFPEPEPPGYAVRLARALDELTGCIPGGQAMSQAGFRAAEQAAEELRPLRVPAGLRPAAATRRDQALTQAAAALRFALARLGERDRLGPAPENLPELAALVRDSADALRGGPPPQPAALARAAHRLHTGPAPATATAARARALLLAAADGVWTVGNAVRVFRRATVDTTWRVDSADRFRYARYSPPRLLLHKVAMHLTPRSVYFQTAVRVALALAAARLIAGGLGLSHGFWVLLAALTVLRSRAADTRTALRPALIGTVLGALGMAGALLLIGAHTRVYVLALPLVMLCAFVAGPLLGPAWAQGWFTVAVGTIFAQLAPANWELAGARVIDVVAGAAVGLLAGVCAWPRGGAGELRRAGARLLGGAGAAVRETTAVATGASPPTIAALDGTRQDLRLTEASYTMYQSERADPAMSTVDWQALVVAGHHIVNGGQALRAEPEPCSGRFLALAEQVALFSAALARRVRDGGDNAQVVPAGMDAGDPPLTDADVLVWLDGVAADLARVQPGVLSHEAATTHAAGAPARVQPE